MIGQAPARLDAEKRSAIGPQRQIRNAGQIDRDGSSGRRVGVSERAIRNIDQFENVRSLQFLLRERHLASGEPNVFRLAAQIIFGREMTPVKAGRHFEAEGVEGSRGESGMQTETDMRGQFRFVVLELERDGNARAFDAIGQIERDLERIFRRREILGRDAIGQVRRRGCDSTAMPHLAAQKTVRAAADFLAAVKRALVLDPVQDNSPSPWRDSPSPSRAAPISLSRFRKPIHSPLHSAARR